MIDFSASGIMKGIAGDTPSKEDIMCQNFIDKVSQMDGSQLAHFMKEPIILFPGFTLELRFQIPPSTEFLEGFFRETKHDRRDISRRE